MDLDDHNSPWGDEPSQSISASRVAGSGAHARSQAQTQAEMAPQSSPSAATSSLPTTPRTATRATRLTPRRLVAQPTALKGDGDESLGPLGPLGPLGDDAATSPLLQPDADDRPVPPRKEQVVMRTTLPQQPPVRKPDPNRIDDSDNDDDILTASAHSPNGPRLPPPVPPPHPSPLRTSVPPHVSIEQAAKPSFTIEVGDPNKVGDLTSSHIMYAVRTRTTSKAFRHPEFEVRRRYRDFLWLYNTLHSNNPGIIVPPPPEKQAVGRFESNFIEARRGALEKMLNKIVAHPTLQHDSDVKLFLESESFNIDIKHREHKELIPHESKGLMGNWGFGSNTNKFVEQDDWFHDRRVYLDALENQLRALLKGMETMVSQRRSMAEASGDLSSSLHALSTVELSPALSGPLEALSELQLTIRDVYERQAQQDTLTLGIIIDEYIRLIGSVKQAFNQRQKAFYSWHAAEADLTKRKGIHDKLLRQGKSQQDRLIQVGAEVADAERKVHQARLLFENMGRLMRHELDRFEKEKVEDFKCGVETFLESAVEAQKELIEKWETFLMQLDAEDDETVFYRPPVYHPVHGENANNAMPQTVVDKARANMEDSD